MQLGSASGAQAPTQMCTIGSLLVASSRDAASLCDASNPAALNLLDSTPSDLPFALSLTDCVGDPARGVWLPLGDYGVEVLAVAPASLAPETPETPATQPAQGIHRAPPRVYLRPRLQR
jgi:hypothetical protein